MKPSRHRSIRVLALLALAVPFLLLTSCGSDPLGPVSGEKAREHAAAICAFGPRPPGTDALRKTADYIEAQLKAISPTLELERQTFAREDLLPGVEFQNLICRIPGKAAHGEDDKPPFLAVGAHYDSKITHEGEQDFEFLGALDSAASCGVLIELARELHANKPLDTDVWLIWFDGEESIPWEWDHDKSLIGSTHMAETWDGTSDQRHPDFPRGLAPRMRALILLDLLGDPELKIDRDTASNSTLLQIFKDTGVEMGEGERMFRWESPMTDDHIPFKNRGVRTVDLIDFAYRAEVQHNANTPEAAKKYTPWWHTANDTMQHVSADSLHIVGNLVWHALPKIEAEFCK